MRGLWTIRGALICVLATLAGAPVAAAGYADTFAETPRGSQRIADLAPALADDGTFVGARDVAGTVDTSSWRLVSDLTTGEAPRFERLDAPADALAQAPAWRNLGTFPRPDALLTGTVYSLAVSLDKLYVAGDFLNVDGIPEADYIARWDGYSWSAVGGSGGVAALNAPALTVAASLSAVYVGGDFTDVDGVATADYVAKWDGSVWSALGSNGSGDGAIPALPAAEVSALAILGSGVYVGGSFTDVAGYATADNVAHWNGTTWLPLGSDGAGDGAIQGTVDALAVAPTGGAFVAGTFEDAGGVAEADNVARWDGTNWSGLGSDGGGDGAIDGTANALMVSESDLYVGGDVTAAGLPQGYLLRWDGTSWDNYAVDDAGQPLLNGPVLDFAGTPTDLYIAGDFEVAGISGAEHLAHFSGGEWSALKGHPWDSAPIGSAADAVALLGDNVYVAGSFVDAAGMDSADHLARWDGADWNVVTQQRSGALNGEVKAMLIVGSDLYAAGLFTNAAGIPEADYLARWDGSAWHAVGSNGSGDGAFNGAVLALAHDGTNLYAGGRFRDLGGNAVADAIARWDGSDWQALDPDFPGVGPFRDGTIMAIAIAPKGVYLGGSFQNGGWDDAADNIVFWDGADFDFGFDAGLNRRVEALAMIGDDLYAGGQFQDAGGIPEADRIARWDGTTWHALGSDGSGDGALNDDVYSLSVSGTELIVGGAFADVAGIQEADYVARWDGTEWHPLGSNGSGNGFFMWDVTSTTVNGADVFAGGSHFVARWDGTDWEFLGPPPNADGQLMYTVDALAVGAGVVYSGPQWYGPITTPCGIPPFADVSTNHVFCPDIGWMKASGVSTGFDDGTYRPAVAVTRQAMAAFMARLVGAALPPCTVAPFDDVPVTHPFCDSIAWMKETGISLGFQDGTYRPSEPVTRQAMAAFLARLAGVDLEPCAEAPFTDVTTAHPFCDAIAWMKTSGVSTGFGDETFRPATAVTRQAMSAFLRRVSYLIEPGN